MNYKKIFSVRNFLILTILIITFFLFETFREFVMISILVGINCVLAFIRHLIFRYIKIGRVALLRHLSNSIEFITFSSVIGSYLFGPIQGMVIGGLSILGTYIFEKRVSQFSLVTVPVYMIIGYFSYLLKPLGIVTLGIIMSITYNIITNLVFVIFYKAKFVKMLSFSLTNIIFNVCVFYAFGTMFV